MMTYIPPVDAYQAPEDRQARDVPLSHLPRGAGILLAAGTPLAPVAGLLPLGWPPKIAIPTGLALARLGYALWSERRTQTSQPNNRTMETV